MRSVHGAGMMQGSTASMRRVLEQPISPEEVSNAMRKGGRNKAPGTDGIDLKFYKVNWETIRDDISDTMKQMFMERNVTTQQNHGVIVCLPKSNRPITPADYRSITLLNTDYKLLARVIAHHLPPMMAELLQTSQFCGVPGNTIFEAVAKVRVAIAQAEMTRTPLCFLSLDFQEAFDRISRKYLFKILRSYGFSNWFVERI